MCTTVEGTKKVEIKKGVSLGEAGEAIRGVLDYMWKDESRDYAETFHMIRGEGHIFHKLVMLDNWLHGTHYSPNDYFDDLPGAE